MDETKRRAARGRSQRVTGADIEAGRIRVPVTTETKSLLPPERTQIDVILKGVRLRPCPYDPRFEGSDERSGVIAVDKDVLRDQVAENEVLPLWLFCRGFRRFPASGIYLRVTGQRPSAANETDGPVLGTERRSLRERVAGIEPP